MTEFPTEKRESARGIAQAQPNLLDLETRLWALQHTPPTKTFATMGGLPSMAAA
jgi:hypothetical protein